MRKIIVFNRTSLDGAYAGADGGIEWFIRDPEIDRVAHEVMSPDTVLLGRITYQLFQSVWPPIAADPSAPEPARKLGRELNRMTKVVFSRTLDDTTWENSRLVKDDLVSAVEKLKQDDADDNDIVIFGSGTVVAQLAAAGLIDEYLIALTPVVLGDGKQLFSGAGFAELELLSQWSFDSGNVLLHYRVAKS